MPEKKIKKLTKVDHPEPVEIVLTPRMRDLINRVDSVYGDSLDEKIVAILREWLATTGQIEASREDRGRDKDERRSR